MSKLVIIDHYIPDSQNDSILLQSFAHDVLPITYNDTMTKDELLAVIEPSTVSHIAFLYHYPGYEQLPFFLDKPSEHIVEPVEPVKSKYQYFSNNVIDVIKTIRDLRSSPEQLIVDILSCDLNSQSYKDEVALIETELNINIRYSVDKTGNTSTGANWVLESDNTNVKDVYFTDNVLNWQGVLNSDFSSLIKDGSKSEFITWNSATNTYTVVKDFIWSQLGVSTGQFIQLLANETFDGNSKVIDLETITEWQGLFATGGNSLETGSIVKNLGILNGTTLIDGGFIIRFAQPYFKVEKCYSTGTISVIAGGITGSQVGNCIIENCYSTGTIGSNAGGITGQYAGITGNCTITNCYSTGTIGGFGAGGITGSQVGNCIIENCYSTGTIGQSAGGITGGSAGNTGICTITNCYSTGDIGDYAGGITGRNGICTITNCYSTGDIGDYAGGITGRNGICTITNCYSTGSIGSFGGGITGAFSGYQGNCTITNCVSNSHTAGSSSTIIDTGNSTTLTDLNNIPTNWSDSVWIKGLSVIVNTVNNITLPILKAFQSSPWISSSSNALFYNEATDASQFSSEVVLEPGSSGAVNTPVTINLSVLIDASGNIEIFGQQEVQVSNVVVATQSLPVSALYDGINASGATLTGPTSTSNSMFEFWEPSTARATRAATLSGKDASLASGGRNYKKLTRKLVKDIQLVLENSFTVSGASPFNNSKYNDVSEYRTVTSFGELALQTFSHYLLGHIDATAAITNDQSFVRAMLSQDGLQDGSSVYSRASEMEGYLEYAPSGLQGSNADAKLAELLVQVIVSKDDAGILAIAEQVLGQDASRAMDQDNSFVNPDVRQALKFIPGDVIYMNIKLKKPNVIMGPSQKVLELTVENKYLTEENYTLKITLG